MCVCVCVCVCYVVCMCVVGLERVLSVCCGIDFLFPKIPKHIVDYLTVLYALSVSCMPNSVRQ